jgi:xanthine dehydrogenase molybdenum-binding subunit
MEGPYRVVGRRVPKLDAPDKVSGRARYGDDLRLPGLQVGAILRSPLPHARILGVDTARAEALPGVRAVITGGTVRQRPFGYGDDNLPLKTEKVRFVGDEVAAVAAVDEDTAREALELIRVDYEPLPAVFDPFEALQPGAPLVHDERADIEGNVSMRWDFDHGDLEEAEARADVVVQGAYAAPLAAPAPMETHVVTAAFDAAGRLRVWSPVQMSFIYRKALADSLGLDWRRITVVHPAVGGGFGGKIDIDPHDLIAVLLAREAGRPVRIAFERTEEFQGARARQPVHVRLKTGATARGVLVFRDAEIVSDNGAYNSWGSHTMLVIMQTVTSLYRVPVSRVRSAVVYTNKPYGGSVRGFGNPEATFAVEQQMEELADALGLDPMELRLRNANREGDVTPQGMRITSCGLDRCLQSVMRRSGWTERRGRLRERNRGLGAAAFIHVGGGARIYRSDGCGAIVRLDEAGMVSVVTGGTELGQGSETALAMIAAEELGVPLDAVTVVEADTDARPWDVGSHASRTTFVAGNAVRLAARQVREQLLETAADVLGAEPAQVVVEDGEAMVAAEPERRVEVGRVARRRLLRQGGSPLVAEAFYDPPTEMQDKRYLGNISASYGFGAQVAEVEVDPGTGEVRVMSLWVAQDVGRAINPLACEGQIEGGAVMGLGLALSEEILVRDGEILTASLESYGALRAHEVPRIDVELIETGDPEGPFGAKGVGEGGIIPTPAAVANAVADAIGVRPRAFPMRPWRILAWIKEREGAASGAAVPPPSGPRGQR